MTIINDNIDLTGNRVLTAQTSNSVIRYITFTATSVSENSVLTYRTDTEEEWNVSVSLVRCTKDTSNKTYAIRIECPFFTVSDPANKTREVIVEGYVYTNIQSVFSSVYESFRVTGCVEHIDPYVYFMYKTSDGRTVEPRGDGGFDVIPVGNEPIPNSGGWCRFIFDEPPTLIKGERFGGYTTLKEIITPSSIVTISSLAFPDCGLTAVTLNNGLDRINGRAFYGCSGLTSINIPNSVTTIEDYAFYKCASLETITIPSSVTTIGSKAFGECGLTGVTLNTGLTEINDGVFWMNGYLEKINIPNSITAIGENAFTGCDSLTSITIPDSVVIIKHNAFAACGLTSVILNNGLIEIGDSAFSDCHNISNLDIPNSVITIGVSAFYRIPHITYYGPCFDDGEHWGALSRN